MGYMESIRAQRALEYFKKAFLRVQRISQARKLSTKVSHRLTDPVNRCRQDITTVTQCVNRERKGQSTRQVRS